MNNIKPKLEAMLFASGKSIDIDTLANILELHKEQVITVIEEMKVDLEKEDRGLQIIKVENSYGLCTKEEYYPEICMLLENRRKPNLSNAALEVLSIIAYNPKIIKSQIEELRGVSSDSAIYKLLEYNLIEQVGKLDAPGRPTMYSTTNEFLRLFGYSSLADLPELPQYKSNEQESTIQE